MLIKAIGLNRSEILTRSGKAVTKPTLPTQLGLEAAGTIEALRSDVDGLAIGDKVAVIPGEAGRGYYSELALAPGQERSSKYLTTRVGRKRQRLGWRSLPPGPG